MSFNYENYFKSIIDEIKSEGRYRVFIDILRKSQNFPNASWFEDGISVKEDITILLVENVKEKNIILF